MGGPRLERGDSKSSVPGRDLGMNCQPCRVSGGWGQKGHENRQEVSVMTPGGQREVSAGF